MTIRVKGLDAVRSMLGRIGAEFKFTGARVDLPDEAARKLGYLAAGGRDVMAPTPVLTGEVVRAYEAGLARVRDGASPGTAVVEAGRAVLRRLRLRVAQGGADLALAPLDPDTVRRKGSARLLVDSGGLLRALSAATVTPSRSR